MPCVETDATISAQMQNKNNAEETEKIPAINGVSTLRVRADGRPWRPGKKRSLIVFVAAHVLAVRGFP